ncbi:selenocysteine-specific translation elongation factor [Actinomadura decatromicini]|uniref:Selenocysteine-specific elongation factor n=1 Tax=Actinomadura decatromicini TaxID=2604572 RepID=A0A5D3F9B0_9ACTN|nr:selenocysteine-specific translation elongation factor [Actinomadura decatromicini]TYK44548.1 selenocysteine-specific translation elongation factor [Actinomadura decatromicini]
MHVIATAGHVDHGKSTLVRALTGMEPDRLEEERRRRLTIDLGFAWTTLPGAGEIAFVDVPGHERFVANMLAGVGPAPAVLFVVAADEGWMPQSAEHLEALDALGVSHGVLAVTRSDLADPAPAIAEAREWMAGGTLRDVPAVAVSAVTGAGLDDLRAALVDLVAGLPRPDAAAPVRLWADRSFSVRGTGTVVTATLGAGTVHVGDELLNTEGRAVRVRGIEALGERRDSVTATARVALNLRGVDRADVPRGLPLLTPGAWRTASEVDVELRPTSSAAPPERLVLHIGTAAVPCRLRPLGPAHGRLRLDRPLPLRYGDRAVLRDPGRRRIAAGLRVLDVDPPPLRRRGAARARAAELAGVRTAADVAAARLGRGLLRGADLAAMGLPAPGAPRHGDWWTSDERWARYAADLAEAERRHRADHPLEPGMPVAAAVQRLGLPDPALVPALAADAGLDCASGLLTPPGHVAALPGELDEAVRSLELDLAAAPFAAPTADRLAELGLGNTELAAAERLGRLVRVAPGIVLLPDVDRRALDVLKALPQPFTLSAARQAMGTTRRVAVPLLELLAARGLTRRTPDDEHEITG